MTATRRQEVAAGIVALRDATRALRGSGTTHRGAADEGERGALIELASLLERLEDWAEDQAEDDWPDFWLTTPEVAALERHTQTIATVARGISPLTVPALHALAAALATVARGAET